MRMTLASGLTSFFRSSNCGAYICFVRLILPFNASEHVSRSPWLSRVHTLQRCDAAFLYLKIALNAIVSGT